MQPWIAPSILSADFARLGEEVRAVLAAGADIVHFDVMDNHYVPNLTIGPLVCEALRKHGIKAPIDVHLMVKPVDRIMPDFAKAGASWISFHPEASEHVDRTIGLIRERAAGRGWCSTRRRRSTAWITCSQARHGAADVREPGLRRPGVHPRHCRRSRQARRRSSTAAGATMRLEVDGGIKADNIGAVAAAGRRHVRRRLGDLRQRGLRRDDRAMRDAHREQGCAGPRVARERR